MDEFQKAMQGKTIGDGTRLPPHQRKIYLEKLIAELGNDGYYANYIRGWIMPALESVKKKLTETSQTAKNKYFGNQEFGASTVLHTDEIFMPTQEKFEKYKNRPNMVEAYDKILADLEIYKMFPELVKDLNSRKSTSEKDAWQRTQNGHRITNLIGRGSMRYAFQKDVFKLPDLKALVNDIAKNDPLEYEERIKQANDPLTILNWLDVEATMPLLYEQLIHDTGRVSDNVKANIAIMPEVNDGQRKTKKRHLERCENKGKALIEQYTKEYPQVIEIAKNSYGLPAISTEKHSKLMDMRDNTLTEQSWNKSPKLRMPNMTAKVKDLITLE